MAMKIRALLRSLSVPILALTLGACAAKTIYQGVPVSQLSDEQLIEEIGSAVAGLGMEIDRTMFLLAVRPEPAYVLTSSTTSLSGSVNASVNAYSMPVGYGVATYGQARATVSGVSATRYNYTDVNAGARLGNAIATAISQSRQEAYRKRGLEVWDEYQARVIDRQRQTARIIDRFFTDNPDLAQRRMLVAAVAPWVAAEGSQDGAETLERTKDAIQALAPGGRGVTGLWHGAISQVTRLEQGETIAFNEFARLELVEEEDGSVTGRGLLGSGEVLEFEGRVDDHRIRATVANTTHGINVVLSGIVTSSQITAEYEGFGAGQRLAGTAVLLR
jgi:hypothetical protein